jgi:endonuclease-3 related protein
LFTHTRSQKHAALRSYYSTPARAWGPQHWWPAQTRFEVIVGAYLTQNTNWTNVERALANLRRDGVLSVKGVRETPLPQLEALIRPSGYFRQKARRLKTFVAFLDAAYQGSLARMFRRTTLKLRDELLALDGVGPETADSILLYAGNHPVFVVDAYTRRILVRHKLLSAKATYEDIRRVAEDALAGSTPLPLQHRPQTGADGTSHPPSAMSRAARSPQVEVFNEMHGLIVGAGKNYCRKRDPRCDQCPLLPFLPPGRLPR